MPGPLLGVPKKLVQGFQGADLGVQHRQVLAAEKRLEVGRDPVRRRDVQHVPPGVWLAFVESIVHTIQVLDHRRITPSEPLPHNEPLRIGWAGRHRLHHRESFKVRCDNRQNLRDKGGECIEYLADERPSLAKDLQSHNALTENELL